MKRLHSRRQRGVALIALLAILAITASALLIKQLNAESGAFVAVRKNRNAEVLNRAKQALIGHVAMQAAEAGDRNPGRLPCPEAVNSIGTSDEGASAPRPSAPITTTCASIGRLPWRTLGLDKLVDTASEPLWYAVGPSWRLTISTTTLLINSNTPGDISIDGQQVVALIIAPGQAMNVQTAAGCTARNQARTTPSSTMNPLDYIECFNSGTLNFVTTASSTSFNDQVVRITVADIMPAIEAAIANRIEREIVPLLKDAYLAPGWGLSGTDRIYPFAALFANPNTSSFTGDPAWTRGLLPLAHSETFPGSGTACTVGAADTRCNPTLVSWSNASPSISYTGAGVTLTSGCSYWGPTSYAVCSGTYTGTPTQITVSGPQSNGAMSLRAVNAAATGFLFWWDLTSLNFTFTEPAPSLQLNSDGTLTASITATPPVPAGPAGMLYWIYVPGNATKDHALLDSRTSSTTGWFLRNEWHKLVYYALAPGYAASGAAPRACATGISCLSIADVRLGTIIPARATLILAGRSINGSARPSTTLGDYLELGNATAAYERRSVSASGAVAPAQRFNDRIVVIESN